MISNHSRRNFLCALAAASGTPRLLTAQLPPVGGVPKPAMPYSQRSTVAVVRGSERRKMICDSLVAIDEQIRPVLARTKYVVIKPNNVSTTNQLASTHADTLRGILDYLAPRFQGPVVVAESGPGDTLDGYDSFFYNRVVAEHKAQKVSLLDLNREGTYITIPLLDFDLHVQPVRLAARLFDPDAFVFCSAILKTHNAMVVTLSVKNMVVGAPLHSVRGVTPRWHDKRMYHVGVRQSHYNMMVTAQRMQPHWGATVIDGFEGMEGNGPGSGTPVESRVAIASTDFIAADRVAVEAMGVDPAWPGYLNFCCQAGIGQYDLSKIDIRGEKLAAVRRKYQLHPDIERQLLWMGPLTELPAKIG